MFAQVTTIIFLAASTLGTPIGGRIVNGTNAEEGEIPYIVSVRVANSHSCGGSILDERHILTAAHCVQYDLSYFSVQYGLTHITFTDDAPNVIAVSKITAHEDYVPGNGYKNDVAILELQDPIIFGPDAQPTKLPPAFNATPEHAPALLSGWGVDYTGGILMHDLQKVYIEVYSDDDCERIHAVTGPTDRKYHVCAGVPEGGKGQCSGDSGGPLMVNGVQVGIVSWSVKPCTVEGYPGVFTKVSRHVEWIWKNIAQ